MKKYLILFLLITFLNVYAGPVLFFDSGDIAELKERVGSDCCKEYFQTVLKEASGYCDTNSSSYVDFDKIDALVVKNPTSKGSHGTIRVFAKWMEAIGFAYQMTGEQIYSDNGVRILDQVAHMYPVDHPVVSYIFAGGRGDMMRGLAIGYDWLSQAMTDEQRRFVAKVCRGYVEHTIKEADNSKTWWFRYHNYNGVTVGSAGAIAIAISDVYPEQSKKWIRELAKIEERWLNSAFDRQGAYVEGISYSNYGLSNGLLFVEALKRNGIKDLYDTNLKNVSRFYAMSLLPGECVGDARNDSNYDGPRLSPLLLAKRCNSGLDKWLWEECGGGYPVWSIIWHNDVAAKSPCEAELPLAEHFTQRGLCIWRTGWQKEDWMFSVEAGAYYAVIHDQADEGHFTFYGGGYRWAVDSAYANNKEPEGRAQTIAHNCVLINGKGQALSGAGLGTSGKILKYYNSDQFGYSLSDCAEAYRHNNEGDAGVDVEKALRHTWFIRGEGEMPAYAVVTDDIRKDDGINLYNWQMHTQTGMDVETDSENGLFMIKPASASGGVYLSSEKDKPADGKVVIDINAEESGIYYVWARVSSKDAADNSFKVRVNNSPIYHWHFNTTGGVWKWRVVTEKPNNPALKFKLKKGRNTVEFYVRETGAKLDQVLVSPDADWMPGSSDIPEGVLVQAEKGRCSGGMNIFREQKEDIKMLVKVFSSAKPKLYTQRGVFTDGNIEYLRLRADCDAVNPEFTAIMIPVLNGNVPDVKMKNKSLSVKWETREDIIDISAVGNAEASVVLTKTGEK
ncbi:MAG: heparinase II/III family protein [Sedimentisphaeraceae bacterium JB056]